MPGISSRHSAMMMPGIFLSHPPMPTRPSKRFPRATSSIESAITSRLTREAFMPCVPIVMPSEMVTVLNSIGVPPASRMPSFNASAMSRRCTLQVPISVQVLAMPMIGLCRSSFENPDPRRYDRAAARLGPSVNGMLCRLPSIVISPSLRFQPASFIVLRLKCVQRRGMPQRQADIVEPLDQTELPEGVDLELRRESASVRHCLRFERNRELIIPDLLRIPEQRVDFFFAQPSQNNTVLPRIRKENVGKGRRNHHAKAVIA